MMGWFHFPRKTFPLFSMVGKTRRSRYEVPGIGGIMSAAYAVISLMNLVESGFTAQLTRLIHPEVI